MFAEFTKRIRAGRRGPLFDAAPLTAVSLGRSAIEQLLPHRGSMLLLDEIVAVDAAAGRLVARRHIDHADPVFDGHFPNDPVYPGVLQMEAVGQAGLCLHHFMSGHTVEISPDTRPQKLRLLRVMEANFLEPVAPSDDVTILCELVEDNGYSMITIGQMMCRDRPVSVAMFEAMLFEDSDA